MGSGWSLLLGFVLGVLVAAFFGRRALGKIHTLLFIVHGTLQRMEGTMNAIWRGEIAKARQASAVMTGAAQKDVATIKQAAAEVPMDAKNVVKQIFNKL